MIQFPAVAHKIPAAFVAKIELDKQWAALKAAPVTSIEEFKQLRAERLIARDKCAAHCQRQRGGTGGAQG